MYAGSRKTKGLALRPGFAEKYGFETVDITPDGYRLLALSFDGTKPCFAENAKRQAIEPEELTVYLQFPVSLHSSERGVGAQDLRRTEDTLHPRFGGHSGEGQVLALRVQQLSGILSGKVRDSKSAGRSRAEAASEKIRCAYGNQKSGDGQKEISRLTTAG